MANWRYSRNGIQLVHAWWAGKVILASGDQIVGKLQRGVSGSPLTGPFPILGL
jgi:hypothetical protein